MAVEAILVGGAPASGFLWVAADGSDELKAAKELENFLRASSVWCPRRVIRGFATWTCCRARRDGVSNGVPGVPAPGVRDVAHSSEACWFRGETLAVGSHAELRVANRLGEPTLGHRPTAGKPAEVAASCVEGASLVAIDRHPPAALVRRSGCGARADLERSRRPCALGLRPPEHGCGSGFGNVGGNRGQVQAGRREVQLASAREVREKGWARRRAEPHEPELVTGPGTAHPTLTTAVGPLARRRGRGPARGLVASDRAGEVVGAAAAAVSLSPDGFVPARCRALVGIVLACAVRCGIGPRAHRTGGRSLGCVGRGRRARDRKGLRSRGVRWRGDGVDFTQSSGRRPRGRRRGRRHRGRAGEEGARKRSRFRDVHGIEIVPRRDTNVAPGTDGNLLHLSVADGDRVGRPPHPTKPTQAQVTRPKPTKSRTPNADDPPQAPLPCRSRAGTTALACLTIAIPSCLGIFRSVTIREIFFSIISLIAASPSDAARNTVFKKRIAEAISAAKGIVEEKYLVTMENAVKKMDEVINLLKSDMAGGKFLNIFANATPLQQAFSKLTYAWMHLWGLTIAAVKMKELVGDKKGEKAS